MVLLQENSSFRKAEPNKAVVFGFAGKVKEKKRKTTINCDTGEEAAPYRTTEKNQY